MSENMTQAEFQLGNWKNANPELYEKFREKLDPLFNDVVGSGMSETEIIDLVSDVFSLEALNEKLKREHAEHEVRLIVESLVFILSRISVVV